jgi:hypothetical protein
MLERIYQIVNEAEAAGEIGGVLIGIEHVMMWAEEGGMTEGKGIRLFQQLHREGYFEGALSSSAFAVPLERGYYASVPFVSARIEFVTEPGLREIGRLPDPREELLLGLEAAIVSLQQDPKLSPDEKQEKINWLQQVVDVGKGLTEAGIKSIWRGELPPPGS